MSDPSYCHECQGENVHKNFTSLLDGILMYYQLWLIMINFGNPVMSKLSDSIVKPKCPIHVFKVKCFY